MRVCPSTTTCEISLAPSSIATSRPTTQNGPTSTPSPSWAPRATTAVAWITTCLVEDEKEFGMLFTGQLAWTRQSRRTIRALLPRHVSGGVRQRLLGQVL